MKSEFGLFAFTIRQETKESLRDMAKNLQITPAFLSAMEVGRKTIPADYVNKISDIYNLDENQKEKLQDAISLSNSKVSLELSKMNEAQKKTSLLFARKIKNADPDLISKLQKVLNDDKD